MANLIVVGFDDREEAERVLARLRELEGEHLIDLEDACIVKRDERGTMRIKQAYNLVTGSTLGGAAWGGMLGALAGLLVLNPLAGMVAGAAAGAAGGAIAGGFADIGIDDDFIRRLGNTIPPNSSALFILVRRAQLDRVVDKLRPFKGRIIHTSLSLEDEAKLRERVGGGLASSVVAAQAQSGGQHQAQPRP